jgi:chromosome segregation ATPase
VERVKQVLQGTQAQLKNEFAKTDSLDARAKQLEAYHKQEESRNRAMDKELVDLKQQLFKHSQEMFQLKQTEGNLLSEISGSSAAAKNLQSKIHKLDSEVLQLVLPVY